MTPTTRRHPTMNPDEAAVHAIAAGLADQPTTADELNARVLLLGLTAAGLVVEWAR